MPRPKQDVPEHVRPASAKPNPSETDEGIGGAPEHGAEGENANDDGFAQALSEDSQIGQDGSGLPEAEKPPAGEVEEDGPSEEQNDDPEDTKGETPEGEDKKRWKVPPEVQEAIDSRIGREVAKRKDLEEQLDAEKTYAKQLAQKLANLEETAKSQPAGTTDGAYPGFAAETESELDRRETYLRKMERFCKEHLDPDEHPNGYEGNGTDADKPMTPKELRKALADVEDERTYLLPKAREVLKRREAYDEQVKTLYPDLLDKRSESAMEMDRILRAVPGLRARPDFKLLVGDMLAGRAARSERPAAGTRTASAPRRAPAIPTSSAPSHSMARAETKATKRPFDTFAKGGFTDDALAEGFK